MPYHLRRIASCNQACLPLAYWLAKLSVADPSRHVLLQQYYLSLTKTTVNRTSMIPRMPGYMLVCTNTGASLCVKAVGLLAYRSMSASTSMQGTHLAPTLAAADVVISSNSTAMLSILTVNFNQVCLPTLPQLQNTALLPVLAMRSFGYALFCSKSVSRFVNQSFSMRIMRLALTTLPTT